MTAVTSLGEDRATHARGPDRLLLLGTGVAGVIVMASWLFVAVAGLTTRDSTHVPGTWMALAAYVDRGIVYPPLIDGGYYGGTRYMPLFFSIHAGFARFTGEFVASGHLLVLLCTVALLGLMVLAMRRQACPMPLALGLASTALLTATGMLVTTTIRGDILSTALQLAAIQLVPSDMVDRRRATGAAALCVLALFSKTSAIWAPAAISAWLLLGGRWRPLAWFATAYVVLATLGLVALQYVSDGRFLVNIVSLTLLDSDSQRAGTAALGTTLGFIRQYAPATWALMGPALASLWFIGRGRVPDLAALAFVAAGGITAVVLSDPGTGHNHLLDLVVITPLLVGTLWRRLQSSEWNGGQALSSLLAVMVFWIVVSTFLLDMRPAVIEAARSRVQRNDPAISRVREILPPGGVVLSEDPAVPVMLGELPVVLDPWTLLRIGRRGSSVIEHLAMRIEAHEFDAIVLLQAPEDTEATYWYEYQHFGPVVVDAIQRNYDRTEDAAGLKVYLPRRH